jgi:mitogen-activated protein kinase kinase kinase
MLRPSANELMEHPWMLDFREQLRTYEEAELEDPPAELPSEEVYEDASVAHVAAIAQEREIEDIVQSPEASPESSVGDNESVPPSSAPVSPEV